LRERAESPVSVVVSDAQGNSLRILEGSREAGLNQVQWDLEPEGAEARRSSSATKAVTYSERQRARRVPPGIYRVKLETGGRTWTKSVEVRAERDGVRLIPTRK